MRYRRALLVAALVLGSACGGGGKETTASTTAPATTSTSASVAPSTTTSVAVVTTTSAAPVTSEPTPPTTALPPTSPVPAEQPAIWPAASVTFTTPEQAAADFVTHVLGVPPALGEFREGDANSGEIDVFLVGEDGATVPSLRSTLLLRRLGVARGWFVIAAVNESNTIETPTAGNSVPAGHAVVSGKGRGFEALLVIEAWLPGASTFLDQQLAYGGSMETPEPYSVTVDLGAVPTGSTVMLLVRGGVGLETDPGEFSAIPVAVGA